MEALAALLYTPAGVFFNQLAVMLVIFGTLIVAAGRNRPAAGATVHRMYTGLLVLLALRLILAGASITLPASQDSAALLIFIEHSLTITSYIILIWLWVAPDARRQADTATGILTVLVLGGALAGAGMLSQEPSYGFADPALAGGIGLALLTAGTLLLIRLQPDFWGYGAAMLLFLALGEGFSVILRENPVQGISILRLTQIAAHPLLLTLPQRLPLDSAADEPAPPVIQSVPDRKRFNLPARIFDNFLTLGVERDMLGICRQASETISYALVADICLIVSPPTESEEIIIFTGYDQVLEQEIPGAQIAARHLPMIVSAIQKNSPLRLPASSASSDLKFLSSTLRLPKSGHLLVAPISTEAQTGIGALILLTPYSSRTWSRDDQAYLSKAAEGVARLLDRSHSVGKQADALRALERELEEVRSREEETAEAQQADVQGLGGGELQPQGDSALRSALEDAAARQVSLEEEIEHLRSEKESQAALHAEKKWEQTVQHLQAENIQLQLAVDELEADLKDLHTQSEGLRAAREEAQEFIARLSEENDRLKHNPDTRETGTPLVSGNGSLADSSPKAEAELKEALEEISRLQSIIGEAEIKIVELENLADPGAAGVQQWDHIIHLAEEMRQPMSSIMGYSDFLLTESVGLLGALQRKFLERVKSSTNRMSTMVENLVHIAALESGRLKLNLGLVDLNTVIDSALSATSAQIREKRIALLVNLPDDLPTLEGDREAIRLTILHLLHNAVAASPRQGEVNIEISAGENEAAGSLVQISVSDSGEGIRPEDLPAVFNRRIDPDQRLIAGLGLSTSGLSIARTLVEAHGGRIWVDSTSGEGTTFSIVLPVKRDPAAELSNTPGA